jgi:hypothetical protein
VSLESLKWGEAVVGPPCHVLYMHPHQAGWLRRADMDATFELSDQQVWERPDGVIQWFPRDSNPIVTVLRPIGEKSPLEKER